MTTHRWPEVDGVPTLMGDTVPCCGSHCDDLPATDTLTAVPSRVDCPGPETPQTPSTTCVDGEPTEGTTTP
jgi:hypothetical protein